MFPYKMLFVLPAAIILLLVSALPTAVFAQSPDAKADAIILREMKRSGIPGAQLAVVQHGKIVLLRSYGYANLADSIPVKNDTRFSINSCTKAFTGVAMTQLIEEGIIDLSAPVSRYLDSLPDAWKPVTIRQLLTHVSGLPDVLQLMDPNTGALGALKTEAATWAKLKTMPMQFTTGTQFSYNQTNYALLAKIIDKYRGKPFEEVFRTMQYKPAGLTGTGSGDSREIIPHYAPSYHWVREVDGNKLPAPVLYNAPAEFPAFRRAASGMISTAEDLAKWIIALQEGKLFHNKTSLQILWTAGIYNNGTPTQWALGWLTKPRPGGHSAVGSTGGSRSAFNVYLGDDLAVIILTNLPGAAPENFIDEVAGCYNPAIPASDPISYLRTQLAAKGFDKAIPLYEAAHKKDAGFQVMEEDLNDWAYRVMSFGSVKDALELFKLNMLVYPMSWNVYDSYGEALYKTGNTTEAIKMYEKSLALNPENENAKHMLKCMQPPNTP